MALAIKTVSVLSLFLLSFVATGNAARRGLAGDSAVAVFDVTKYGAKPDGQSESALAMIRTWNAACKSGGPAKVLIPPGKFLAGEIVFQGPCTAPLTIEIQGTLLARTDLSLFTSNTWISIEHVKNVDIIGPGTINAQGEASWKYRDDNQNGQHLPDSFTIMGSSDSSIKGVHFVNSKGFHMKILESQRVIAEDLTITAPEESPNTDGIHLSRSTDINITNSVIGTGDDCISIGEGNTNVYVFGIHCGPGHGLSVGSLGKRSGEESVKGVVVRNCTLTKTTNGVRIKSYRQSPSLTASDIIFEDILMEDVKNPIIIDQNYASRGRPGGSNVKISDVHFRNIRGTTISEVAVALDCSDKLPCEGIEVSDIDLKLTGGLIHKTGLVSRCTNAKTSFLGTTIPPACA